MGNDIGIGNIYEVMISEESLYTEKRFRALTALPGETFVRVLNGKYRLSTLGPSDWVVYRDRKLLKISLVTLVMRGNNSYIVLNICHKTLFQQ